MKASRQARELAARQIVDTGTKTAPDRSGVRLISRMIAAALPDVRGIKVAAMYGDDRPWTKAPPPAPERPAGRDAMAIVAQWISGAPTTLLAEVSDMAAGFERMEQLRAEWQRRPGVGGVEYRERTSGYEASLSAAAMNVYGDDGRHWCVIRLVLARIVDGTTVSEITGRAEDHGN